MGRNMGKMWVVMPIAVDPFLKPSRRALVSDSTMSITFEKSLQAAKAGEKSEPLFTTAWRVYQLLSKEERRAVVPMALLTMISSVVELMGIAVVIPVIGIAVKPDMVARSPRLGAIFEWSGMSSGHDFVIFATVVMCLGVTVKVILSVFVQWWQTRFSFRVAHRLSGIMWDFNFAQSIEDIVNRSSGKVLTEIHTWPMQFAKRGLFSLITLISEIIIISAIGTALILYKPLVMLAVVSIIGIGGLILRLFVKGRVASYNAIEKEAGPKAMGALNNSVRGFREIVTFNAVGAMKKEYLDSSWVNYSISSNLFLLNQIPRPLYEWLAILSIGSAILVSFQLDIRNEDFLSMLTFLALGAYRVMPAISKISQRALDLRSSVFAIEAMEKGMQFQDVLAEENQASAAPMSRPAPDEPLCVGLEDVTFQYQNQRRKVLDNLNFTFEAGTITAITGPSGAGKTTLINCLMGLNQPSAGRIRVKAAGGDQSWVVGEDLRRTDWLNTTSYLSQSPFLFPGTVRDNLTMRIPNFDLDEEKTLTLIERLGLADALNASRQEKDEEEAKDGTQPLAFKLVDGGENLSGGQQQRIGLLRSLQVQRPVMILDEATSDLDPASRDAVFEILQERCETGCTIIMVTHDQSIAARCHQNLDLTPVRNRRS